MIDKYKNSKLYKVLHTTISPKNGYLIALVVITLFSIATYASYAMFTVYEEHQRVLTMQAGSINLVFNGKTLDNNNGITVPATNTQIFDITLTNNSSTPVKADVNYTTTNNDAIIKYVDEAGSTLPDANGDLQIPANGAITVTIVIYNPSASDANVTFSYDVGLPNASLVGENTVLVNSVNNPFDVYNDTNSLTKTVYDAGVMKLNTVKNGFQNDETNGLYDYVDDYGTKTYIYRGTNVNNYVTFGGITWRILRIQSDGTIKLVTDVGIDYQNPSFNTTVITNNGVSRTGIRYDESNRSNIWKYNGSTVQAYVNAWYNNVFASNASKLVDNDYCSDEYTNTDSWGVHNQWSPFVPLYGVRNRVEKNANNEFIWRPSVTCVSGEVINSKAALITADEYILLGGGEGSTSNYYVNFTYWTMSPEGINTDLTNDQGDAYYVSYDGGCYQDVITDAHPRGVRPVVTLKANTQFTSGNGTSGTPYVIQ